MIKPFLNAQPDSQQTKLARQDRLYRSIVEFSSDPIFVITPDGRISFANSEACQRYGFSHDELIGMMIADFDTPEYSPCVPERLATLMREGHAVFESAHRRKQGAPVLVEVNARVMDFDGEKVILAVVRDITDHKKSDELLLRQNGYLRALHETTLGLIGRLELHSLLSAIITRAATLMNTEHGYIYLLNDSKTEMIIQLQLGAFDSFEHHPLKRGEGMAGYVWGVGEPFQVDDYSQWPGRINNPQRDILKAMAGIPLKSDGEMVGVIGLAYIDHDSLFDEGKIELLQRFAELASLALDNARLYEAAQKELDERTKAEESLRKLSHAVEQSPVSIIITDTQGNIEYANPYSTQLTGYELDELLGQNPRILKSGFTKTTEYKKLWETVLAGGEWRGEFQNHKKNGDLYWELALISPIRDADGSMRWPGLVRQPDGKISNVSMLL